MLGYAGHLADVEVHVWGKNAVEASYFSQCTKSRFQLSTNTSVVLIELESAYQVGGDRALASLHALLARVRHGAPHAAIGFIAWPSQGSYAAVEASLQNGTGMRGERFDLMLSRTLLHGAERISSHPPQAFYGDSVHPNLAGHMLLGAAAAYMISKGILDTPCHSVGRADDSSVRPQTEAELLAHNAMTERTVPSFFVQEQKQIEEAVEMCIGSADQLPLLPPVDGWTLKDEGGLKGVRKLGFVSTQVGATMTIGPLLSDIKCGMFDVSLGYLQSWRPEMGAFRITCVGCSCTSIPGSWSAGAFPYPVVQTWSYATSKHVTAKVMQKDLAPLANASLTVSTRFALLKREPECFLNITHVPKYHAAKDMPSRVRIDTLGIELASCLMNCHFSKYPYTKHFAIKGRMCATGQDLGKRGHVSPACFKNGTQTCRVAMEKEANEGRH